jgi:hypothetical protein
MNQCAMIWRPRKEIVLLSTLKNPAILEDFFAELTSVTAMPHYI